MVKLIGVLAVLVASPSLAKDGPRDPHEKQVVADCSADALRYCKRSMLSGRDAIIFCMMQNRDKLVPKCSRHLWD